MSRKRKVRKKGYNKEIIGIIIISFGILSTISLFSSKSGIIGAFLKSIYLTLMGFGGFLFPILIIALGLLLIINKLDIIEDKKIIYLIIIFLSFLTIIDMKNNSLIVLKSRLSHSLLLSKDGLGGGLVGSLLGYLFLKLFGSINSYIIISLITLISILLFTEANIKDSYNKLKLKIKTMKEKSIASKKIYKNDKKLKKNDLVKENKITKKNEKEIVIHDYMRNEKEPKKDNKQKVLSESKITNYELPSLDLLDDIEVNEDNDHRKEVLSSAKKIESTMKSFGIDAKITQINKGPTVTCYELEPGPGIKVSRITNLSDDLALKLATSDVRIEAPIPGKAAVGIEVPNLIKDNVGLKEVLESKEYLSMNSTLPLMLGKDISGNPIISTIDKMPHLLIAGATGSGKSVCINTIIMSILFKSLPNEVKLLLIDPKVVELSVYNGIPHLLIPVVTDPKKAASALDWAVDEMEKRYKLFAENNVRDINSYNDKFNSNDNNNDYEDKDNEKKENLPKIIIIIDELADLMMVAAQEIEDYICRLAQMARAAGIYLIIATQRPSVDVITGTIKANIPSRISFSVSSQIDSRTILDMGGAEKLLGKGDMLFYPSSFPKPIRIQGAFVSDREIEKVVNYLEGQSSKEYDEKVIEAIENKLDLKKLQVDTDELLPDAINLVVEEGQASISYLQRKLKIGYARAARIVDTMEDENIVGGHEGSKPRKVLISKEDLNSLFKE